MILGKYELLSEDKVKRLQEGTTGNDGQLIGKLPDDATGAEFLAAYDKLGGLIKKDGLVVKTGSFYDFKKKIARKKPEVTICVTVNGKKYEYKDGDDKPKAVQAAELALEAEREAQAEE